MSRFKRIEFEIGKEYGWLTLLGEAEKDRHGHLRYSVRCRCGKEYAVQSGVLMKPNPKCAECNAKYPQRRKRLSQPGDELNGWLILKEAGKNPQGAILYDCQCLKCGHISRHTRGDLTVRKGNGCQFCPPDYHFTVTGNTAEGILPDGSHFLIDACDIKRFSQFYWGIHEGYIKLRGHRMLTVPLHRFILGYDKNSDVIIDHINRNRLDCRRENLRIVTPQQNSMNKSMQKNNTSGYTGVFFDKSKGKYCGVIGLNDRRIRLGYSDNPVECAQLYNAAADLLFGEFRGHINAVAEASEEIKKKAYEKCRPFMADAMIAAQPPGMPAAV